MKQQQTDLFKKRKEEYDAAGSAEEKKALVKQYNSSQYYEPQDKKSLENKNNIQQAVSNVNSLASKNEIVSPNVWNTMQTEYQKPTNVIAADGYLKTQLQKIQSGKTSYSDQIKNMMAQIQGRDKFSYDVDSDPLFQQALASAMSSGKTAMQDTIGQASALTGGYGSTYATAAGNQAYNAFIQDAYDNLPQYYQMAMDAYQREGDELYRQYGMLVDADATEYGRNITAYDAMSQYRNQLYNEDYQMYRDSKADALSSANLQLSEHGQLMSDAVNSYNVNADYDDTMYNRGYQSWLDSVNNAWRQTEFERGVFESDRAYERDVKESDRAYEENVRQYNDSRYWDNYWNEKDADYKNNSLYLSNYWNKQDQANWDKQFEASRDDAAQNQSNWEKEYTLSTGDTDMDGQLSSEELEAYQAVYGSKEKTEKNYPKEVTDKLKNAKSDNEIASILSSLEVIGVIDATDRKYLDAIYMKTPLHARQWRQGKDSGGTYYSVMDQYGNVYTLDALKQELMTSEKMTEENAEKIVENIKNQLFPKVFGIPFAF